MTKSKKLKQENYNSVADFIIASLERDLADFTKVFRTINNDFLTEFKAANEELKNATSTMPTKTEQKNTTQSLYNQADAFREKLLLLKIYIKRAKLNVPPLQEAINALKSRNIDRVVKIIRDILPFFTQNAEKIKDMPEDFLTDIPQTLTDFEQKSTQQNLLMSRGKQATAEGEIIYEKLYNYIKETAEAGKVVYKNSSKKDDYTISKVIQRTESNTPTTKTKEKSKGE